jgi:WD40 repeat protein
MVTSFRFFVAPGLALTFLFASWGQPTRKDGGIMGADAYGDPLPREALARLGTIRFRQEATIAAFSPDGSIIASGGGGLCFWNPATGQLRRRLLQYDKVSSLAFSPDGKTVFVGGFLVLVDIATGKERKLQRVAGSFERVAFSPDGRIVAAGESIVSRPSVTLWDVATGGKLRQLEGHTADVESVAFSPDGKTLASGAKDRTVRLWDVASGKERRLLKGHSHEVRAVAFSLDNKFLASVGDDGVILLWDWKSGKELHRLEEHDWPIHCVNFSPDSKLLASGAMDGSIRLWDMGRVKPLRQWKFPGLSVTSLGFSPDGSALISTGAYDEVIRFWETASGKEIHPPNGHTAPIKLTRFSPGDEELISVGKDRKVLIWDLATSAQRRQFDAQAMPATGKLWDAYAISPDGKVLAFSKQTFLDANVDPVIHIWNSLQGKELFGLSKHHKPVMCLGFSTDGKLLASGDMEGRACVWDMARKELRWTKKFPRLVRAVVFSPDGNRFVTYADNDKIRLWELGTGKELYHWDHPQITANRLVFSPDGQLLASSDGLSKIRVWSVASKKEAAVLSGGEWTFCLAFSRSSHVIAGGGMKFAHLPDESVARVSTIRLWELVSGQEIRSIDGDQNSVECLAFGPNDRTLVSGGMDSTILRWDLTYGKMRGPEGSRLDEKELDRLWTELGLEASKAYQAMWTLAAAPKQAMAYLKTRLRPSLPANPQRIASLIAELDSNEFSVRARASYQLEELAELAEPALRKTIEGNPSAEVQRRVEILLQNLNSPVTNPDRLRSFRSIEVLEQIATEEALQVLRDLAQGAPSARLTQEALVALKRLGWEKI